MKKYEAPQLEEIIVEIEDVIAESVDYGANQAGDSSFGWGSIWKNL